LAAHAKLVAQADSRPDVVSHELPALVSFQIFENQAAGMVLARSSHRGRHVDRRLETTISPGR